MLGAANAMGVANEGGVDPTLRVRGVDGLRVIDCSIIPFIPSANTNAPAMAIGSKAADLVGESLHAFDDVGA
ncbi:MAG: GMC oxidoreductase [Rhizobiaceae bacterium]